MLISRLSVHGAVQRLDEFDTPRVPSCLDVRNANISSMRFADRDQAACRC